MYRLITTSDLDLRLGSIWTWATDSRNVTASRSTSEFHKTPSRLDVGTRSTSSSTMPTRLRKSGELQEPRSTCLRILNGVSTRVLMWIPTGTFSDSALQQGEGHALHHRVGGTLWKVTWARDDGTVPQQCLAGEHAPPVARIGSNEMAEIEPVTTLSTFSSPNATPTDWSAGRELLVTAELYWLSTVRPDGRPHVTPLLGVWLEGALHFCTGPNERKSKNLAGNPRCILTTGSNTLDGLDLVVEGTAELVADPALLKRVADTYESKYGPHFTSPQGTWSGLGGAIRGAEIPLYRVAPETAFGFGKGGIYSQTRWVFS